MSPLLDPPGRSAHGPVAMWPLDGVSICPLPTEDQTWLWEVPCLVRGRSKKEPPFVTIDRGFPVAVYTSSLTLGGHIILKHFETMCGEALRCRSASNGEWDAAQDRAKLGPAPISVHLCPSMITRRVMTSQDGPTVLSHTPIGGKNRQGNRRDAAQNSLSFIWFRISSAAPWLSRVFAREDYLSTGPWRAAILLINWTWLKTRCNWRITLPLSGQLCPRVPQVTGNFLVKIWL